MTYPVWSGERWVDVPIPVSGDEPVVVPNINAVVYDTADRRCMLLQRRDKPDEPVRGLLEIPGGRWRAGESPDEALRREVYEETGVTLLAVAGALRHETHGPEVLTSGGIPAAVVVGRGGGYPSLHVVFECVGEGTPRGVPGEVAEPRWWPVTDVVDLLAARPEEFVGVTRTILGIVLDR